MLITRVWQEQPGKYFCISTKSKSGKWTDHFFSRARLKTVSQFVRDNLDKDVYWCPHGFNRKRRLKDYAVMPNLLWADLDEADPSDMTPMPTIAWQSSPGRYCGLWLVDKEVDESINRRLTYFVGADHGGWDITQVLRVPGTFNYKYPNKPRVKRLWADGPEHTIAELENMLPSDPASAEPQFGEAIKVYKRYEKKFTAFVRREILGGKPHRGKRSEVLWRLNKELLEAGLTTDEAFVLLWASPWNKFRLRKNGERQLKREIDKAMSEKLESAPVPHGEDDEFAGFALISMEDVEEEQLDWIWYPFLARSELTILEGDPGLGKSYLAQMVGLAICDGKKLPRVKAGKPARGKVLYFDMENSAGSVTKRRLIDNHCKNLSNYYQEERPFMIDDEDALEYVYSALERVRPQLVVFDTLNVYIGKADTHKASETAQAMSNFVEIARRFDASVLVVRHLTKSTKEKALYRGQGSIAQTGAARVVLTVGQHPDEPETRVMAVTKLNVTRKPKALSFTIEALPDTLKAQDRSQFCWGDWLDLTSDEIVSVAPVNSSRAEQKLDITQWLRDTLSEGPMLADAVKRAAEAKGIGYRRLLRIQKELGIEIVRKGKIGSSHKVYWSIPDE